MHWNIEIILNSMTEAYMSPNKCTYGRGKHLLKVLVVEVQIELLLRFPVTVGCFLCCFLLVNSVIIMVIARKSVERVFILIQFFSSLKKMVIVQPWCIKENSPMGEFEWIIWLLYSLELSENHRFSHSFSGGRA